MVELLSRELSVQSQNTGSIVFLDCFSVLYLNKYMKNQMNQKLLKHNSVSYCLERTDDLISERL